MPLYFYHLKFELYPTSDPIGTRAAPDDNIWLPTAHTSVFDDLPAHTLPRSDDTKVSEASKQIETASRDWRFGFVSIETLDPTEAMAVAEAEASSSAAAAAAPSLGPNLFGPGTATKATCVRLNTHHTNVGWGVVHFYRDEHENTASRLTEAEQQLGATATAAGVDEDEDCSTLCIPAVPAYMTPGDLWGFIGERWREDISHCRMVMTSKMNRYLVLLKFRHGKVAREWKKMFDGTVFNTMEVCTDRQGSCMVGN